MKCWLWFCILCLGITACGGRNNDALLKESYDFRQELVNSYNDSANSPIPAAERKDFKGIHFFPVNLDYVVTAHFKRTANEKTFKMDMSRKDAEDYVKYGEVTFTLQGNDYTMSLYQSLRLAQTEEYKNYLALLFKDATSGHETYGGGRYIDLHVPSGDTLTINFNKAYQPYCAYTEGFSCPIPPKENYLPIRVEAGVKF